MDTTGTNGITQMTTEKNKSLRLVTLINEAAEKAGNEAALGRIIGATRHHVNAWKQGTRTCPLEMQVLMAQIAGRCSNEALVSGLLEKNNGTDKGRELKQALGR